MAQVVSLAQAAWLRTNAQTYEGVSKQAACAPDDLFFQNNADA
jgi:hypothetical protein